MIDLLSETTKIQPNLLLIFLSLIGISSLIGFFYLFRQIGLLISRLLPDQLQEIYQKIVVPYQYWLALVVILIVVDLIILISFNSPWLKLTEIVLGLLLVITISWLLAHLFDDFFEIYLLDFLLQGKAKVSSELLITGKLMANSLIFLTVFFIFAETHQINLVGLIASLGVGGLAVAFAAQKTLEQLLGGIVLYIDRPFVVNDYIGLPDGTFGKVESIGWRSTKIRTSGKGTLVIVPNNSLTQVNIENFTGVKKVISLIYLTFSTWIPDEEKALIRQVILESTKDIVGIDPRNTGVAFKDISANGKPAITEAQINFFVLGSGEISMEFRRQLLDISRQKITKKLKDYGIAFEIKDKIIDVDSPITI